MLDWGLYYQPELILRRPVFFFQRIGCKLAQEQYDTIGNEEYETVRLRRLFAAFECTAELNAELLQSTVSAVLVMRQTVRLQLKNGQIIGKDDLV